MIGKKKFGFEKKKKKTYLLSQDHVFQRHLLAQAICQVSCCNVLNQMFNAIDVVDLMTQWILNRG